MMLNLSDFGASESSPDNSPAFDAAMDAIRAIDPAGIKGCRLVIPTGTFKLSRTVLIDRSVRIEGEGGPHGGSGNTTLLFNSGIPGILVQGPPDGFGGYSLISGLTVRTPRTQGVGSAVGVTIHATRVTLENLRVTAFSGPCILIEGGVLLDGTVTPYNCNLWQLNAVSTSLSSSHGIYVRGNNANVGNAVGSSASGNDGWGFLEEKSLGNIYTGCHSAVNGQGPYKIVGHGSCSLLLGCYSEDGQPPSWIDQRVLAVGGQHGAGFDHARPPHSFPGTVLSADHAFHARPYNAIAP